MNRRESLAILGASAIGASTHPSFAKQHKVAVPPTLNTTDPAQLAMIQRKLAWSMDDSIGYWWLKGMRYGALPPTYTPFWNMLIGTIFKVRDIDADTYAVTTITTTFYTNLTTGALLESFNNPVTGKVNKISYAPPRPAEQHFNAQGEIHEGASPPGVTMTRNTAPGPAWVEGDDVWIRSDMALRAVPADPTKRAFQVEDLSTYFGSLRDVADPMRKAIPAGQVFTDLLNYPGWLEMGDRNGHYFSRCFGRKVFSAKAMPAQWQQLMSQRYPDLLRDPAAALKAMG